LVGRADHGIEARELMAAVEIAAELILEIDLRQVEAPSRRQRKPGGQVDGVGEIETVISVASIEIDRRHRIPEDDARSGDEQIIADGPELARRLEPHIAVIEAGPNHELIVTPEHLVAAGRLDRAAD